MGWKNIPLADTVVANGTGLGADGDGYIIGSPPVWKDDSDATYASFAANYIGDGQPAFYGGAVASVAPTVPDLGNVTGIRVRLRVAAAIGTNVRVPAVVMQDSNNKIQSDPGAVCPTSPGWVTYLMPFTETERAAFGGSPSNWRVSAIPHSYASPGVPNELHRWNVQEARLEIQARSVAPPCRMFPREDDLGVGGGRNYPPPKSQQRSGRGVGYY